MVTDMVHWSTCSFFFVKQKTAYEMRISDWSSDVCSSDLPTGDPGAWTRDQVAAGAVAEADIKAVAASGAAWGTKTGLACSDVMVGWLMGDADARAAMLTELLACFLTGKGELRADFAGDKGRMTDCVGSAARIADAVQGLPGTRAAMHVADELAASWRLGSRFAERDARDKREARS